MRRCLSHINSFPPVTINNAAMTLFTSRLNHGYISINGQSWIRLDRSILLLANLLVEIEEKLITGKQQKKNIPYRSHKDIPMLIKPLSFTVLC